MATSSQQSQRWILAAVDGLPALVYVGAMAVTLAVAWSLASRVTVDAPLVEHLFYLPVLLAALRFGARAGVAVAIAAVVASTSSTGWDEVSHWVGRGMAFTVVALVVGSLSSAHLHARSRERDVAGRERELADQRVALVQVVSHELRTPLTVIRGSVETLRVRPGAVATPFRPLLDAADRATARLGELVDVVLAAADEVDGGLAARTTVKVDDLVRHAADSLRTEVSERLRIDVPRSASLLTVEPYLWMTMRCLLDNAAKFSAIERPIEVRYRQEGHLGVITLQDHGPGLPSGFESRAFDPFTQGDASTSRNHAGIGMGLHTAYRLTHRLGGDLQLHSGGDGVTAVVRLPLCEPACGPAEGPCLDGRATPNPRSYGRWSARLVPTRLRHDDASIPSDRGPSCPPSPGVVC